MSGSEFYVYAKLMSQIINNIDDHKNCLSNCDKIELYRGHKYALEDRD